MRKYIVIITLLALTAVCQAQTGVKASLDTARILIGGQAHLVIEADVPRGAKVFFPNYTRTKPVAPGIEILKGSSSTAERSGHQLVRRTYTLTAWEAKRYTIPAQEIVVNGKADRTRPLVLEVRTIPVDTVRNTPMPPDDIQQVPFSWGEWLPVMLLGALALVLLGVAFWLYRILRNRKIGRTRQKHQRILSPYEKARLELEEIRARKRMYAEQKAYYTDVTLALRTYLAQRFGINALEMTSGDILESLDGQCSEADVAGLREVFDTADLVKFAKYSTGENEMDFYLDSVVRFIERTKKEEIPAAVTGADGGEEARDSRSRKVLRLAIGLLVAASVALLLYTASEAYALLM